MRGNATTSRHDEMMREQHNERTTRGQEGSRIRGNATTSWQKKIRERWSERQQEGGAMRGDTTAS
jgi:hypothetical protein